MKIYVDLNSDLGEGFADYKLGEDAALLDASDIGKYSADGMRDPLIMNTTVKKPRKGVAVGAHPGFPDLMGLAGDHSTSRQKKPSLHSHRRERFLHLVPCTVENFSILASWGTL